jgi:hypothetical protein
VVWCGGGLGSYFPDLHALVQQYSHILKTPYRDPNVAVKFNVSGSHFETRIGCVCLFPFALRPSPASLSRPPFLCCYFASHVV